MIFRWVSTSTVSDWLQRNDPTTTINNTIADAWHQFLVNQTAASGTINDLERIWLNSKGATGETEADLWQNYLNINGFVTGATWEDGLRQFFTSLGVAVTFRLLNENGSGFLKEDGSGVLLME